MRFLRSSLRQLPASVFRQEEDLDLLVYSICLWISSDGPHLLDQAQSSALRGSYYVRTYDWCHVTFIPDICNKIDLLLNILSLKSDYSIFIDKRVFFAESTWHFEFFDGKRNGIRHSRRLCDWCICPMACPRSHTDIVPFNDVHWHDFHARNSELARF